MYVRSQLRLLPWQAHANVDASLPWEVSMRCGFAGVVTQAWTQEGSGIRIAGVIICQLPNSRRFIVRRRHNMPSSRRQNDLSGGHLRYTLH